MIEVVLASRNQKKIGEMKTLLAAIPDICVLSLDDIGYTQDIDECGTTFTENALIKARVGAAKGRIGIADDSGLEVDALHGAPGIFSARYAGGHASDAANNEKLIAALRGIPDAARTARYVCAVACVFPDGRSFTVRETCEGIIGTEPRGENGFGYDPYFIIPSRGMTFAEMNAADKHTISHRGRAMRMFARVFPLYLNEMENHYVDK